jgi:hypothetical protein
MLKHLAICVLLASAFPIYGQEKSPKPNSDQKPAQAVEPKMPPVSSSVGQPASQPQEHGTEDQPKSYFERLFSAENLPNIGLLIAGIIGIGVAIRTLGVLREQTKAMMDATKASQRSIEVQEAEFVQWVDIGDWEVEEQPGSNQRGWSRSETNIQRHPGAMKFRISFPLLNNTPRPLFIHSVRTELVIGSEKIKREFLTKESLEVPPKSAYTTVIDTELTYGNVTEWLAYRVPILAVVDVSFSNAIGKKEITKFERLVTSRWGPDGETRTVSKGHKAEQQAN